MTSREKSHQQVRRLKRMLRPLPRRATVHRYPILKWFSATARRRAYLWSFRGDCVIPAIYAGCILSLMPIYGLQMLSAFALALLLKANLMVLVGLQWITNPLTVAPLYYACYRVGETLLGVFTLTANDIAVADVESLSLTTQVMGKFTAIALGAILIGTVIGGILSAVYSIAIKRYRFSHNLMRGHKAHDIVIVSPANHEPHRPPEDA